MKRISVFCGASIGKNSKYVTMAKELGRLLVQNHLGLVYGGGNVGLMGTLADSVLASGGEVIGVIPQFLVDRELAHPGATKMHVVETMHERKKTIFDLADGFIAMPGGLGTLEEIIEVLTWVQLGIHNKPCGFLNVDGYYDNLFGYFNHAEKENFLRIDPQSIIIREKTPDLLLKKVLNHPSIQVELTR